MWLLSLSLLAVLLLVHRSSSHPIFGSSHEEEDGLTTTASTAIEEAIESQQVTTSAAQTLHAESDGIERGGVNSNDESRNEERRREEEGEEKRREEEGEDTSTTSQSPEENEDQSEDEKGGLDEGPSTGEGEATAGTTIERDDESLPMQKMNIEIRLIDDNNTHSDGGVDPMAGAATQALSSQAETSSDSAEQSTRKEETEENVNAASSDTEQENAQVEYVSDAVLTPAGEEGTGTTTETEEGDGGGHHTGTLAQHSQSQSSTPETESDVQSVDTTLAPPDGYPTIPSSKVQLSSMLVETAALREGPFPDVRDEDLPVLEGEQHDDEDDEPEPVEECLANKKNLKPETVERMQHQAEKLTKRIRRLNKQQQEFCTQETTTSGGKPVFTDQFNQCSIWREEKIVHYYKLMRDTYCADYSKWPNAPKVQQTYGQYLKLYETLYAFQKQ